MGKNNLKAARWGIGDTAGNKLVLEACNADGTLLLSGDVAVAQCCDVALLPYCAAVL